ncbi:MAG: hypothetical protein AB8F78_06430 [Saprospiraceae bacterium]
MAGNKKQYTLQSKFKKFEYASCQRYLAIFCFLLAIFFANPLVVNAQHETCGNEHSDSALPNSSTDCIAPQGLINIALNGTARAALPQIDVPYVFHYIQYNDDGDVCTLNGNPPPAEGTRFEMTCNSGGNYSSPTNVVRHVLDFQTQFDYLFENLRDFDHVDAALPIPYAGVLGDTRIRMVPGSTVAQAGAQHCSDVPGVYIWESEADLNASGLLSNPAVQAIIVYGDYAPGVCTVGGSANNGNVYLFAHLTSDPVNIKKTLPTPRYMKLSISQALGIHLMGMLVLKLI